MTKNKIIELLHEYPNDWNVSFRCEWNSDWCNNGSVYNLFIFHPKLVDYCGLVKNPNGTVFPFGVFAHYYTYNEQLSLIEDIIGMPISEFTDGAFDYE